MKAFYWFLLRYSVFFAVGLLLAIGATGYLADLAIDFAKQVDPKMTWAYGENPYQSKFLIVYLIPIVGFSVVSIAVIGFIYHLVAKLRQLLLNASVLDNPNNRSMHSVATPRGGGWAIVVPAMSILFLNIVFDALSAKLWRTNPHDWCTTGEDKYGNFYDTCSITIKSLLDTGMLFGLTILVAVSWLDDRRGIPAKIRLLVQLIAVAITYFSFLLPDLNYLTFSHLNTSYEFLPSFTPLWLCIALPIVMWVGFINLYNFMDGIDGITAVETISLGIGVYVFFFLHPSYELGKAQISSGAYLLNSIISLCCIGFLFHNWHPAKIFLGDVGSVTIGYLMGFFLLVIISAGFWYVALTLPLYYLADGGITLARRILRGEKFWEAHRTHFYQRAAQAAGRHDVVVLKIAACNVVLIGIAMLELLVSPWFVLAAPLPVALLLHNMAHQRHIGVKSANG